MTRNEPVSHRIKAIGSAIIICVREEDKLGKEIFLKLEMFTEILEKRFSDASTAEILEALTWLHQNGQAKLVESHGSFGFRFPPKR